MLNGLDRVFPGDNSLTRNSVPVVRKPRPFLGRLAEWPDKHPEDQMQSPQESLEKAEQDHGGGPTARAAPVIGSKSPLVFKGQCLRATEPLGP